MDFCNCVVMLRCPADGAQLRAQDASRELIVVVEAWRENWAEQMLENWQEIEDRLKREEA